MTTTNQREEPDPFRPALVTLSEDVRERVDELLDGLDSEGRALEWLQEVTIRTLGTIDQRVYRDFARQFRGQQGVLLAAMLEPSARRGRMRALDDEVAERTRENLVAHYVTPAHRKAFRRLRRDATDYADAAGDGDAHNPKRQRFVAMRPELSELEQWQERALDSLLEGFEDRAELLDWGHDLLLATHGELDEEWVTRVYDEESTASVMTGETPEDKRARRLFAAHHLLPYYRAGVRVLSGRASEVADEGTQRTEAKFA
ncbi:hypothetical protein C475_14488 [Halosimplex carlsbadense 2-9-1]|uniref:Uncharacterized protein n=1 Tax=Halosimplex carlsbadense 2-9-1 TaxID=797114 RepID=M0CNR1_9EURY|nr:hypothetical protein [Halosimplex carlsbadense]ELZ23489.1 hypothetical protein C475_14488 [Halosimplex carlsbadense 2-9-1]